MKKRKLIMAIGFPGVGKSTYANNLENTIIISRDNIVLEQGIEGETYNDIWKRLNTKMQKNIDKKLLERYEFALKYTNKDIYLDLTNLTIKSRKKWNIIEVKEKYNLEIIGLVFNTDLDTLKFRLNERSKLGKTIPFDRLNIMINSFEQPTTEEGFDFIKTMYN